MSGLSDRQAAASDQGAKFEYFCEIWLQINKLVIVQKHWEDPISQMEIDIVALDDAGPVWVECAGSWESKRNGAERTDTIYKKLGVAAIVRELNPNRPPYWLLTSHLPSAGRSLQAVTVARAYFDRIEDVGHQAGPAK